MQALKTIVAAVTLLAVGVNPLAAGLMPCCAGDKVPTRLGCCQRAAGEARPAAARHKCCEKQSAALDYPLTLGCCCVKTPPASMPAGDGVQKSSAEQQVLAIGSPDAVIRPVLAGGALPLVHDGPALWGPPLLALYCIWLN